MSIDNVILILTSIILLLIGFSLSALTIFDFGSIQSGFPVIDLAILSLGAVILGALYFGRFSGVAMFFAGIFLGKPFLNHPIGILAEVGVIFYAAYVGHVIGRSSSADLDGDENMFENQKKILIYLFLLIILIIGAGLAVPFIPKFPIIFR
ncbi:MAG: hypothetical protein ABID38_00685 [Candidatus Diapherotrites archaeon]